MWQDKVKEIIDILENSNVNEIEVTFWGRKVRVVKNASGIVANHFNLKYYIQMLLIALIRKKV